MCRAIIGESREQGGDRGQGQRARSSRVEHRGNGLDLHQLAFITEDGHAQQGTGDVVRAERVPDHLPGGHQVLPSGRRDENPGADDVFDRRPGIGKGGPHVLEGLRRLAGVVPGRRVSCHSTLFRAGTSTE